MHQSALTTLHRKTSISLLLQVGGIWAAHHDHKFGYVAGLHSLRTRSIGT